MHTKKTMRRKMLYTIVALLFVLLNSVTYAEYDKVPKTLLLLCDSSEEHKFSIFSDIIRQGGKLSTIYSNVLNSKFQNLFEFSIDEDEGTLERNWKDYDNFIIFCSNIGKIDGNNSYDLYDLFMQKNFIISLEEDQSSQTSQGIKEIAEGLSIRFPDSGKLQNVYEFYSPAIEGQNDMFFVYLGKFQENFLSKQLVKNSSKVLYKGMGFSLGNNNFMFPILLSSPTSFLSHSEAYSPNSLIGNSTVLMSALQSKTNTRVVFSGSKSMFLDEIIKNEDIPNDNEKFISDILDWTFQRRNVLKINKMSHYNPKTGTHLYRTGDVITYKVYISQLKDGKYQATDLRDLQLELRWHERIAIMTLHPIILDGETLFDITFQLPSDHGTYQLSLFYLRPGFSLIEHTENILVLPTENNLNLLSGKNLFYYASHAMVCMASIALLFCLLSIRNNTHQKLK